MGGYFFQLKKVFAKKNPKKPKKPEGCLKSRRDALKKPEGWSKKPEGCLKKPEGWSKKPEGCLKKPAIKAARFSRKNALR